MKVNLLEDIASEHLTCNICNKTLKSSKILRYHLSTCEILKSYGAAWTIGLWKIVKYESYTGAYERASPKQFNHFLIGLICKDSRLKNDKCFEDQYDFLHNNDQGRTTGSSAKQHFGYNWV